MGKGELPEFGEAKVEDVRVGLLEFALSLAGKVARKMGQSELKEILGWYQQKAK